jgi:transcriptional regulator with XRE-family HTH domain
MPKTLDEVIADFSPESRARIEAEAARMAAEVMTLREIRQAFRLTQESLAKALDMEQESVSRIERRADLLLSTLRSYIAAMGGSLKLVAEFPDRPSIQIETLSDLSGEAQRPAGRARRAQAKAS